MHKLRLTSQILVAALLLFPEMAAAQAPTTTALHLEVRIDGNEESTLFSFIRDIVPLRDGSLVVAEPREARLRRFGVDGQLLGVFGRDGGGPGEYRTIGGVGLVGDSVWVRDVGLRRTTWLTSDGRLIRTTRWDVDENARPGTGFVVEGYLRSGLSWGERNTTPESVADETAPRRIELLTHNGTERIRSLAVVPSQHARYRLWDGPSIIFGVQPFADAPLVISSGASDGVVVVDRRSINAPARAFSITAISERGDTLWSQSVPYRPRAISRATRDSVLQRVHRSVVRSGLGEDAVRRVLHLPSHYSPVTDAFQDADGRIWLRREDDGPRVIYQRFSRLGALDQTVEVDRALRLRAARGASVWGIRTDEDGVPSVERYRIGAAASSRPR